MVPYSINVRYLAWVLLYDSGKDGGVKTLTRSAYKVNTSANEIEDRNNAEMYRTTMKNKLKDFEVSSQSFL